MERKTVTIQTSCGAIKGQDKGEYNVFKGIRYANAERFEYPVLVEKWDEVYDATEFGPAFLQYGAFYPTPREGYPAFYANQYKEPVPMTYSEDALNLNIWAPKNLDACPVIVFIHGGSFVSGANCNGNISNGEDYCKRGVILVAINYRLNAFGNARGDGHLGNYMLSDQIAALQWVKKNISDYGGDPEQLVVMGESAGAISIQTLLYSEKAEGLFKGAIMMSGAGYIPALGNPTYPEMIETTWGLMKDKFGVTSIDELKTVPAKQLFDTWNEVNLISGTLLHNAAKPIVDGEIIPVGINTVFADDRVIDVPCIMGLLSEDMWPFYLYKGITDWAEYCELTGRAPIYAYYLDRQMPGDDNVGAYHGCDLWYAFNTLNRSWRNFEEVDTRISNDFIDYLCAFAANLVPICEGKAEWKEINSKNKWFMHFGIEEPSMIFPEIKKLVLAAQNTTKPFPGMD